MKPNQAQSPGGGGLVSPRRTPIALRPIDRVRIGTFLDEHPTGVTPGQICGFCLTDVGAGRGRSIVGLAALVRSYLDDLVRRSELVSWDQPRSAKSGWQSLRLYGRTLPEGFTPAYRGDGSCFGVAEVGAPTAAVSRSVQGKGVRS